MCMTYNNYRIYSYTIYIHKTKILSLKGDNLNQCLLITDSGPTPTDRKPAVKVGKRKPNITYLHCLTNYFVLTKNIQTLTYKLYAGAREFVCAGLQYHYNCVCYYVV